MRVKSYALTAVACVLLTLFAAPTQAAAATGCQDVGASPGVYTSTTLEYANDWSWSIYSYYSGPFYWYLKKSDGSIYVQGSSDGSGSEIRVPANYYYLQLYNASGYTLDWSVCYYVA